MTAADEADRNALELISDVQRFGLLSATSVVDRYAGLVDRAVGARPPLDGRRGSVDPDEERLLDSVTRAADSYVRLLDAAGALVGDASPVRSAAGGPERVTLPAARPGTSCATVLWVHNPTSASSGPMTVTATTMTSATGSVVPVGAVSVSPSAVEPLAAGSSSQLRLHVDVPRDQPAGRYHGLVLVSAAPEEPLSVSLDVEDGAP